MKIKSLHRVKKESPQLPKANEITGDRVINVNKTFGMCIIVNR